MTYRSVLISFVLVVAMAFTACSGGGGGGGGGSVTPPIPATITIEGLGTLGASGASLGTASTYTITVTETASGGGSQTPGPLKVSVDNAAIGTVSGSSLVTGLLNATGHLTVTDTTTGLSSTIVVTVLSTHPASVGDTLTLIGQLVHTIDRPLPAPTTPQPPSTTTTNVSDVLKIASTTATFGAQSNLIDETTAETDVAPLQTITTTSDAYTHYFASGSGQNLFEVGATSTDSNGVNDTTTFGAGAGLLDELPDMNGATWTNTAAQTFSETDPDTTTIVRTAKADGTYTETDTYLGLVPATTTTNTDLSATINGFAGQPVNVAFGAPSGSGASAMIPILVAPAPPPPPATPPPPLASGSIPEWYPTVTIFADAATKTTAQTIPAACNVAAGAGATATRIAETTTHLDTALGTYETRTETLYDAPGFGPVCAQLADTIDTYYDYTGQSPQLIVPGLNFAVSSSPIQIDTLAETLGFQTGTVSGSSVRRSTLAVAPKTALRIVTPIFDHAIESVYRRRREALVRYVTAHRAALAKEFAQ